MRLIGGVAKQEDAEALAAYYTTKGIAIEAEIAPNGGYQIWVVEEDRVEEAVEIYRAYSNEPNSPEFRIVAERAARQKAADQGPMPQQPTRRRLAPPMGKLTILIMAVCAGLLIWAELAIPHGAGQSKSPIFRDGLLLTPPFYTSLFDYPPPWEAAYTLTRNYPVAQVEKPQTLPPAGQALYREATTEPTFQGIYAMTVAYLRDPSAGWPQAEPMFVKLREGQAWRLFTPALLHGSLLHLFINLLWMIILGNQVEARLGAIRYLLFILIAAVISNTAQYLMNGPAFVGISGVVCALFGLVWMRQQVTPWEGYQLNRPTIIFVLIFLFGMVVLQAVSFIIELRGGNPLPIGIANAAHLSGLAVGVVLGRLNLFSLRTTHIGP